MIATKTQAFHDAHLAGYKAAMLENWQHVTYGICGEHCQVCDERIWTAGFVRPGDRWSPAVYRHEDCFNDGKQSRGLLRVVPVQD